MADDPLDALRSALAELAQARAALRRTIGAARGAGYTQREIAQALGVSQAQVWRILQSED